MEVAGGSMRGRQMAGGNLLRSLGGLNRCLPPPGAGADTRGAPIACSTAPAIRKPMWRGDRRGGGGGIGDACGLAGMSKPIVVSARRKSSVRFMQAQSSAFVIVAPDLTPLFILRTRELQAFLVSWLRAFAFHTQGRLLQVMRLVWSHD